MIFQLDLSLNDLIQVHKVQFLTIFLIPVFEVPTKLSRFSAIRHILSSSWNGGTKQDAQLRACHDFVTEKFNSKTLSV